MMVLLFFRGQWRLLTQTAALLSISFFLLAFHYGIALPERIEASLDRSRESPAFFEEFRSVSNRKLLEEQPGGVSDEMVEPEHVGELECSKDDILVHQQATEPMPSGIPTYTVNVLSTCPERSGCSMARIHLTCGWFSTARQINPAILRRLRFNDCLLNGGRPLPSGLSVSFQYANTFPYTFSISRAECLSP